MRDFTEGSIPSQLLYFTVPMFLANLLQAMSSIIDAIWVGRLLGHQSFAAVSSTVPVIFFLVSAIIGLTIATNVLVGQAFGSKDMDFLSKVLTNSFISTGVICLFLTLAGLVFSRQLLSLLNTPADIREQSHLFFTIAVSGMIITFAYNWFGAILRGLGDAKTPLMLLVIMTCLNIIFVPSLILGLGPLPRLGLAGAPLGTIIANLVMLGISYYFVLRKHVLLNIRKWDYSIDWGIIKQIFVIGVPAAMQMALVSIGGILLVSLVNKFGSDVTAAYGIGVQLDQLSTLPAMAIGMSVSSMVAQNLGAEKYDRVREILKYSIIFVLVSTVFFFALIYGFPRMIISIFTKESAVSSLALGYIRIVSFSYFILGIMFVLQGILRGAGDTMYMFIFSLIGLVIVRYPAAYVLSGYTSLSFRGIWFGIVISSLVGFTLSITYYYSGRWRKSLVKKQQ